MDERLPPHRYSVRLRVRNYEIDGLGHVNNAVYLHYLELAAWEHSDHLGMTLEDYRALDRIFILRRLEIDYLRQASAGDVLEVTTWAHELRGARAVRKYEIKQAETGQILVQATGVWAWIESSTGRPRPIPPTLIELFTRPADTGAGVVEPYDPAGNG